MAYIDDLEEIRHVIQLYIDGSNGDVAKLERAFHPSAWMFGLFGATRTDFPITQFFDMVRAAPGMAGPNYRAIIQSIDLSGDAGVVALAEPAFASAWAAGRALGLDDAVAEAVAVADDIARLTAQAMDQMDQAEEPPGARTSRVDEPAVGNRRTAR